ncbi:methyltransferase [Algivirga pacifica]|uniref:Methyltransferase n=1 Tax=Algivirga pacifica TaxID=1162670 RepID=A0ABP9D4M5_9BACT
MSTFSFQPANYKIKRYPSTSNHSLKSWSAADEYMLQYLSDLESTPSHAIICNDRFGYLGCHLSPFSPQVVINYKSQEKAIRLNLEKNGIAPEKLSFYTPLDTLQDTTIALIRIPKSTDLFEWFLHQVHTQIDDKGEVICSFMTKYFNPQLLKVAEKYFEEVEQSKAWKKARLLILKKPKKIDTSITSLVHQLPYQDQKVFEQYYGVFSAKNIDYATQFFMENMLIEGNENTVLDLASGNGVLAWAARQVLPNADIHLMDDAHLAVASSQRNLSSEKTSFHFEDHIEDLPVKQFDLIVSNPPFHFEHENNIEVSIGLFQQVKKALSPTGNFQLVANKHLNYKTHLEKIFEKVEVVQENDKFIIYQCR